MKKLIITGLILFLLINIVSSEQDVNITVKTTKGLCLINNDVECQYCNNETFSLEGTEDHIIHLSPQKPYSNCGDYEVNATQTLNTYLSGDFLSEIFVISCLFLVFLGWVSRRRQ